MMKLCIKVWLSVSSNKGALPIEPKVIPSAVSTHRDLHVMLTVFYILNPFW